MRDPSTPDVAEEDVELTTDDGVTLTGRLFGSGGVGVTLAHMHPADATSWYPAARRLAQSGYMALAFNFRGYADAGGTRDVPKATIDLEAARRFLTDQGARRLVHIGASMGGTASIIAAESMETLAVVAVSAPLRFMGLDAALVAGRVQRPVLLLAARGDETAFQSLETLSRALPNPDTLIYDGDAHGTNLLIDRPEAIDEILAFLGRYAPLVEPETTEEAA